MFISFFSSLFLFSPGLLCVELVFKVAFGVYISMYSPVLAVTYYITATRALQALWYLPT
jgi:hypothetical protein